MAPICPNCSAEMRAETVHGVPLEVCPQCEGIWFHADALRTLLEMDPEALAELEQPPVPPVEQKQAGPSTRLCPDCMLSLQQYHYLYNSPIVLEACMNCGGFFVENEQLGKMQQWLDQAQQPMTKDEEAKVVLAEATIAHDEEMRRQQNLLRFFNTLRRRPPGWLWLIP
ncbi:MAG TPA: zf-TFIIB domain-containing protein [Chthonomonadaceae bacterium]|nr:zf-TFIIB domain-containing protein [Chthonomonadaceae bacterium]